MTFFIEHPVFPTSLQFEPSHVAGNNLASNLDRLQLSMNEFIWVSDYFTPNSHMCDHLSANSSKYTAKNVRMS